MSVLRVLVTGASGFIGRQTVAPLLARGFAVHAIGRRRDASWPAAVLFHAADLADRARVREVLGQVRPSHVLHCAWYVEHGKFWHAAANMDWVGRTLDLAEDAATVGLARFVGVGTCAEYDWSGDAVAQPRRENDPLGPTTLYGACKAQAWTMLQDRLSGYGVAAAWGRLFHLYGLGEPSGRLMPLIIDALRLGREACLGPGHYERDFMAVTDAGAALAALVAAEVNGPVNIASGQVVTVRHVAERLGALVGRPDLLRLDASAPREGDVLIMRADIQRLLQEVGFKPEAQLDQSLASYVNVQVSTNPGQLQRQSSSTVR